MITELNSEELQAFIKNINEKQFLLVDVRQDEEYRLDHIPGAAHIPLAQIQFDPYVFEDDRNLVFYCRSGVRSRAAAMLVAETGYDERKIYNLTGGMLGYTGEILLDIPRVDIFPTGADLREIMEKSIDFEKGAFYFYKMARERLKESDLYPVMEKMGQAEISHAKAIYNQMKRKYEVKMEFDLFFDACRGEILEGGKTLKEVEEVFSDSSECLDFIEFAIDLEFSAYDLYKTMAQSYNEEGLKEMFYTLAQAEKKHLEKMIQAVELCGPSS